MEPWLKGSIPGWNPVVSHLLRASEQIRGDIDHWIAPVSVEVLLSNGAAFHVKHLAGSTDRLCTYLCGQELTAAQLMVLKEEHQPSGGLVEAVHSAFERYEELVKSLREEDFSSLRYIGRQRLPVTAVSLAIHIVEHGQRHTGQAIALLKR